MTGVQMDIVCEFVDLVKNKGVDCLSVVRCPGGKHGFVGITHGQLVMLERHDWEFFGDAMRDVCNYVAWATSEDS